MGRIEHPTGGSCTVAAVNLSADGSDAAPAYALTSGRCIGLVGANDLLTNVPVDGLDVTLAWFIEPATARVTVPVEEIVWASTRHDDLAVLRLGGTVGDLRRQGVDPLHVRHEAFGDDDPIRVVGAPVAGALEYVRAEDCFTGPERDVLEGAIRIDEVRRSDCVNTAPGSQGSAVVDPETGEIGGLLVTMVLPIPPSSAPPDCSQWRACETRGGGLVQDRTAYFVDVAGLWGCVDAAAQWQVVAESCPLGLPGGIVIERGLGEVVGPNAAEAAGLGWPVSWNVTVSASPGPITGFAYYRYKSGSAEDTDCSDGGYSDVRSIAAEPVVDREIDTDDGIYQVCVYGGPGEDEDAGGWQRREDASSLRIAVDSTAPVQLPSADVLSLADKVVVRPVLDPPEIATIKAKLGAPDRARLRPARRVRGDRRHRTRDRQDPAPRAPLPAGLRQRGQRIPTRRVPHRRLS